ncbi:uncharacterized protein TM35_000132930 [Trypanosoma theileri]|uniref:Uncharacterized protein n=1 Tax=Trypanosoma theileri TaxID=67003 RepID=A0A1X0NYJ6_9TRYP|nr:uncharacterized protein TM35_000132930 [Trypanosoma theileri]ORC89289.1 hypothetical protein TM35_000132930 [Trypanosoma theileri]
MPRESVRSSLVLLYSSLPQFVLDPPPGFLIFSSFVSLRNVAKITHETTHRVGCFALCSSGRRGMLFPCSLRRTLHLMTLRGSTRHCCPLIITNIFATGDPTR